MRLPTGLVAAAVVALGVAAAVDGVQRGGGDPLPPGTTTSVPEGAPVELREAGVRGVLTYADRDCRVRAVRLPDLEPHPSGGGRACRLTVSGGNVLSFGRAIAGPQAFLIATCRGRTVTLRRDGTLVGRLPGCSPSWRPDGVLTVVRDGEVVGLDGPLDDGGLARELVLLSREELAAQLSRPGERPRAAAVEETAWLRGGSLAAIVRTGPGGDVLAVFRDGRLLARPIAFGGDVSGLRVSPRGSFAAARTHRGAIAVDRQGARLPLPLGVQVVAWSPDEAWIAATRAGEIAVFPLDEPSARGVDLPIAARDLVWR
jgi:hypothetical protein